MNPTVPVPGGSGSRAWIPGTRIPSLFMILLWLLTLALSPVHSLIHTLTMSAFAGSTGPLTKLLRVTKNACDVLTPMVVSFYQAINGETSKLKADASVFTIADGMVQHLLIENLFHGGKFHDIVGEEEGTIVNIETKPFMVSFTHSLFS